MTEPYGPLQGLRVIDFTERMQGPYATQMLGDMGADIIKVERPHPPTPDGRADERYGVNGRYGQDPADTSFYSAGFLAVNRNKRSVTVGLKNERGKEVIRHLITQVDVMYENFRPGVMTRLGFGYEECAAIRPDIVYASASGYGSDGPYLHRPGQDLLAQAIGGLGTMNQARDGRPLAVGMSITDMLGAMNGAYAVAAALVHRERTGDGQHVEVSLLNSAIAALAEHAIHFLNTEVGEPRRGSPQHANPYTPSPYGFYATQDGYIALSSGRQIPEICAILGIPDLSQDERFHGYDGRLVHKAEMDAELEAALRKHTTDYWMERMLASDIFAAPVNSFEQALNDPQVRHNGMVVDLETPSGQLSFVGVPWKLSRTPASVRTPPPLHGQHSDEVLMEFGFSASEIAGLREAGAI